MFKKFWFRIILFVTLLACVVASCQKKKEIEQNKSNMLTINFQEGDLPSLHPHELISHLRGISIAKTLFEGLTRINEDGKICLAGAETVEISMNKLHYTFVLRENFWSNGTPVTAFQYENSWKAAIAPNSPFSRGDLLYMIKNGEKAKKGEVPLDAVGVKAMDEKTLVVDLEYPSSSLLDLAAQPICLPMIDPNDIAISAFNGPFYVDTWERSNLLRLKANPFFWNRGKVFFDQIDVFMMGDHATIFDAYTEGRIDWIGLPLSPLTIEQVHLLEQKNAIASHPVDRMLWLHLNVNHPLLSSSLIRKALSLALDRKAIVKYIMPGGEPLCRAIHDSFLPIQLKPSSLLKEDRDQARLSLEKGLLELGFTRDNLPSITIAFSQQANRKQLVEYIKHTWKEVLDLDVQVELVEWTALRRNLSKGCFEICAVFQGSQCNDPIDLLERVGEKRPSNFSQWLHPRYRQLISLARYEPDSQRSWELLAKAEEILLDEIPFIPLCSDRFLFAPSPGLKGYSFDSGGGIDFSYSRWDKNEQ